MAADLNKNPTVEVLYKTNAVVGEGPFFEEEKNQLLWVDINGCTVNFLNIKSGENRSLACSDMVSSVFAIDGSEDLLVSHGLGLYLMNRETGKLIRKLCSVEEDKPQNRINDAKCDSSGRVWFGTMTRVPVLGQESGASLYSYHRSCLKKFDPVLLSNGLAWNKADDTMYYNDSHAFKVYSYSYDKVTGDIMNQQVLIDYAQDEALALPDGMCIDDKGRLWVASFGGERITCWDPATKERVMTVMIPGAKNITSCCFGGPNYEWMFVTSATYTLSEEELAAFPNSGSVFVIKDLGAKGPPPNKFTVGPMEKEGTNGTSENSDSA